MATATATNNVASNVATETAVQIDTKFVELWTEVNAFESQLGGKWAKAARYCIEAKLSREVIQASLETIGGMKKATAQQTTSRILDLMEPDNAWKLDKMEAGALTVRASRSATITYDPVTDTIKYPTISKRPAMVRITSGLQSAVAVAIEEHMSLDDLSALLETLYTAASDSAPVQEAKSETKVEAKGKGKKAVKESASVAGN